MSTFSLDYKSLLKKIEDHFENESLIRFDQNFITSSNRGLLISNEIPDDKAGLYIFWWRGNPKDFLGKSYTLTGPNKSDVKIEINQLWLDKATKGKNISLYVGKTTKLRNRIQNHLKLNSPKVRLYGDEDSKKIKHNSVSQLRYGIERLLDEPSVDIILKNVGVSFYSLDGQENAVNRFYLEDYLVGKFTPLLNVDIER